MPTVYVIHAEEDASFVEQALVAPLPALGFDRWVSAEILARRGERLSVSRGMELSAAILTVVSDASAASPRVREELEIASRSGRPVISVPRGPISPVTLAELMPPVDESRRDDGLSSVGERISWNEEIFSYLLGAALNRHDYNRGSALMTAFDRHIAGRPQAYAARFADNDLSALRKKRQFTLMRRYARGVLLSGTTDFGVRRQYAQSLIESREYAEAVEVLESIVREAGRTDRESFEARGLLGRIYKQQYVDAPGRKDASTLLRRAIDAYESVFVEDSSQVWHGINAASLILRAHRDRIEWANPARARHIAGSILETIERLGATARVWDYATRVEALVAVEAYDEADEALSAYLAHPDIEAFEVSSTHRQFEQVLQMGAHPRGQWLLERLWQAVERHRSAGASHARPAAIPMLLRVTDPDWKPQNVPDLEIHARLGTVISITGSTATVKALLNDPVVISVDESRPTGTVECHRSVPFIRVADNYTAGTGPFIEKGGGALIAIVDDGIDVLHHAFLDANGRSRIVGIWNQRDPTGLPPPGFDFGTHHPREAVAEYVARKAVPPPLGRNVDGHGTHVASIAAGRAAGDFAGGVASEAQLLIVMSDTRASIGYSHTHIAALQYIDRMATDLGLPVVVNVSQGMNAGAHDGRSALEVAFDEFSKGGRRPGRVIVKSAGNERDKNGHANVTLLPNAADRLHWRCQPDRSYERIELWWSSANEFRFRLAAPSGDWSNWVEASHPAVQGQFRGSGRFTMAFVRRHVDNGDSQLVVEIGDGTATIDGDWTLEIRSDRVPERGDIHAWIERGGGSPSSFITHMSEEMTLSIPGTAHNVIAVGAVDAAMPIMVGEFSSYGPTRDNRCKPEVSAPGINVHAARGGTADGVIYMDGTSMAAPHVTGAIALVLSRATRLNPPGLTASQISSALRQNTINYSSHWDRGQGFGVIDVAALLAAF